MRTLILSLLLLLSPSLIAAVAVHGVRVYSDSRHAWLEVDLAQRVAYQLFALQQPDRVVIDLQQATLEQPNFNITLDGGAVQSVRTALTERETLRLVLELTQQSRTSHRLRWIDGKPQLLVTLLPVAGAAAAATSESDRQRAVALLTQRTPSAAPSGVATTAAAPRSKATLPQQRVTAPAPRSPLLAAVVAAPRPLRIAVDAGHGGKDPGAVGVRGTHEKDVVLAIARRLATLINGESTMQASLVRDGDYFIPLRQRMVIARQQQADLFISIHADSFNNRTANGASAYILSERGATSEAARWLAAHENAADLAGGITLEDKEPMVASVLLDMSQTKVIEESRQLATQMLQALGTVGALHSDRVQQAGFAVLKSPDIPSLLVETGFLSHPKEELKLRDPSYQAKLAAAMLQALRRYASTTTQPGSWLAERRGDGVEMPASAPVIGDRRRLVVDSETHAKRPVTTIPPQRHTIRRGDTLYSIARRYQIRIEQLRRANGLSGSAIRVGEVLQIPQHSSG